MNSKELFPRKIKELRARNDMSQEELAEKIDVHSKTITKFENPKPTFNFETVDKMADAFGVLPSYFFNPIDLSHEYEDAEMIQLINKQLKEMNQEELKRTFKVITAMKS